MGESANLAFYAIVYAKGLVPRERLQDAMHRATLEGLPMEQVLMQWGLLTQPQVDELVGMRRRLGRACASCKKLTYLLQDQSEDATPCEHCGGTLQPPRRSARLQRPGQSGARQSSARTSGRVARPDLDAKLAVAEERILAKALECVETRLAQEDLTGFLKAVVKKASQAAVEAIAPQVEALESALEGGGGAAAAPPVDMDAIADQVLARVQDRLPTPQAPDVDAIAEQVLARVQARLPAAPDASELVEQATQSAIEAVQEYDLGSLPDRVAQQVLSQLEQAGPSESLVDAVVAAVGPQASGGGAAPELSDAQRDQLLRSITAELDAKINEPNGLAEQMAQHVLDKIPGLTSDSGPVDAELSADKLAEIETSAARAALAQVEAKLDAALNQVDERVVGVMAQVDAQITGVLERVEHELATLRDEIDVEVTKAAAAAAPKATIVQPSPPSGAEPLTESAAQQIMDTVETRLSEFDMAFDAVIMEATEKAVEAMESRLAEHQPAAAAPAGGEIDAVEVTREATAQVMRVVERRLAELPDGNGDPIDEQQLTQQVAEQVLGVVEARLAGLEGGGGGGGDVDVDAIEQRILREVEDRLRALPGPSAGTETTATGGGKGNTGVYDRKFIALAREVKQLKDTVDSGGGGGSVSRQSADLLNSEEFKSLLEARINAALAAAGHGTPGTKKGGELVGLLNTPEFKQVFDQKINQVLSYVKGDLIPSAVKKALREVESS